MENVSITDIASTEGNHNAKLLNNAENNRNRKLHFKNQPISSDNMYAILRHFNP